MLVMAETRWSLKEGDQALRGSLPVPCLLPVPAGHLVGGCPQRPHLEWACGSPAVETGALQGLWNVMGMGFLSSSSSSSQE